MISRFCGLAVVTGFLMAANAQATLIIDSTTNNGSFEADGTTKQTTWDTVTDWLNWGAAVGGPSTVNNDSGVENTPSRATDGEMLAFLQPGNAAYNLTTYEAQVGDVFSYLWDFTTAGRAPATVSLAYQDVGGNVVNIAGTDTTNPDNATPHLDLGSIYVVSAGDPIIGQSVGLTVVSGGNWPEVDNFRLDVIPEPSSLALLGLGGLAMALRRRKN